MVLLEGLQATVRRMTLLECLSEVRLVAGFKQYDALTISPDWVWGLFRQFDVAMEQLDRSQLLLPVR